MAFALIRPVHRSIDGGGLSGLACRSPGWDFELTAWWGVYAPAALSAAQAATRAAEIEKVAWSNAFRDALGPLGVMPTVLTQGAFAEFQAREAAKWGKAVRDSGASVD